MMNDHFRQLGLMMQFKTYQIFSMFLFKVMTFKISIQDGIKHLLIANEIPPETVLEDLYKMKIRGSLQLQTVLAMYKKEIDRNLTLPSNQRLKTMERRHTDQTIRTVLSVLREQWENAINGKPRK